LNANPYFAKVQPARLKYRKQSGYSLSQFRCLRDGSGEDEK
jgi:hypothetical protein